MTELDLKGPNVRTVHSGWHSAAAAAMTAVAAIWLSAAAVSIWAPDMITGSEHEHLPIAALTVWLWAAIATAYVLLGTARVAEAAASVVLGVSSIWIAVAVASIYSPMMVTGTDPTLIPIVVLVAPVVGAVTTGLVVLQHAVRRADAVD